MDREISLCFERFRNHDPVFFEQFLRLMHDRTTRLTVAVTEAPPDQILVAQGVAKEARKMWLLCTELPGDLPQAQPGPRP